MIGYDPENQAKLFYHSINLEEQIPASHILRKIQCRIDYNFIYEEVKIFMAEDATYRFHRR